MATALTILQVNRVSGPLLQYRFEFSVAKIAHFLFGILDHCVISSSPKQLSTMQFVPKRTILPELQDFLLFVH